VPPQQAQGPEFKTPKKEKKEKEYLMTLYLFFLGKTQI
jgi:hypothetical protein